MATANTRQMERKNASALAPWDYTRTFHAVLALDGVAASTMYQLIDLSDTSNFPHADTTSIIVKQIRLHAEKAGDGVYRFGIGPVIENDGTDGTMDYVHQFLIEATGNPTDSTDRFAQQVSFPSGLNLEIQSGAGIWYVTNAQFADDVLLQNDVARVSPVGSANPAVGDLMLYVLEVSGTGTVDFHLSVDYDTY